MGSSSSSDGVGVLDSPPDPVPADAMVQNIMNHPFGNPPEAGTRDGDADRAWFVFRLTVSTGWYMSDLMMACMEASCQWQLGPRLDSENPGLRLNDRVPVYKPGELLYVAAKSLKRVELQTLEVLRMKFHTLADRPDDDPRRMSEWGPESQRVAEEWIAILLQLRRSIRQEIIEARTDELLARRVLANIFQWLRMAEVRLVVLFMYPWLPSNNDDWDRPRCRSEPHRLA